MIPELQRRLLEWQRVSGRHDLPWHTRDPYGVWVSEVMLQQTQVSTGWVRYPLWMARFPTLKDLASATEDEVLSEWEGLGYYARARNLRAAAQQVVGRHAGVFPEARNDRLALPGVGPSTASAIGAFAFDRPEAILDGNVARVWSRWWGDRPLPASPSEQTRFWWGWAQAATPTDPRDLHAWTQGMMDLGATICVPKNPRCSQCPWNASCRALALGTPEAWPIKAKKAERKEWVLRWVWKAEEGRVWVIQRPPGGPWEGLWALPEGEAPLASPLLGQGKHELSHRRIRWSIRSSGETPGTVSPWPGGSGKWVTAHEFQALALPRPLRVWWGERTEAEREGLFFPSDPPA